MQTSSTRLPPGSAIGGPPPAPVPTATWLLARATFGYTPADAIELDQLGHDAWLDRQLNPLTIDDSAMDARLASYTWLAITPHDALADPSLNPFELTEIYKAVRLERAVHSRRQLLERVVEYWNDHFSVYMGRFMRIYDDLDVWRPHALGRFRELLGAVTRSASMLAFLDNDDNVAGAANENLAREILELHTLGVDGPYTEDDVREFARCLTGWNYVQDAADPNFGAFAFDPANHDHGAKDVLGIHFPGGGGVSEVEDVLDHLADHPATIDFVVRRMAQWFLGDAPPERAIDAAKARWQVTAGDIREVLRELLSESVVRELARRGTTKFRRPFEWFTAVLRATGLDVPASSDVYPLMVQLGQAPFEWPAPDGYPDERERWVGLVQPRWAVAADLTRGTSSAWMHGPAQLMPLVGTRPRAVWAAHLDRTLTGGRLRASDVDHVQAHVNSLPPSLPDAQVLAEALELCFTCPSYQTL